MLEKARDVSHALEDQAREGNERAQGTRLAARRRTLLQVRWPPSEGPADVQQLRTQLSSLSQTSNTSASELADALRALQRDVVTRLGAAMSDRLQIDDPMSVESEPVLEDDSSKSGLRSTLLNTWDSVVGVVDQSQDLEMTVVEVLEEETLLFSDDE